MIFCLSLIASCGKKNNLAYPEGGEEKQKHRFEKVVEGYNINDSDKNFKYYYDNPQLKNGKKVEQTTPEPLMDFTFTKKTPYKETGQ